MSADVERVVYGDTHREAVPSRSRLPQSPNKRFPQPTINTIVWPEMGALQPEVASRDAQVLALAFDGVAIDVSREVHRTHYEIELLVCCKPRCRE